MSIEPIVKAAFGHCKPLNLNGIKPVLQELLTKSSLAAVRSATCPAISTSYFHNAFSARSRWPQNRISRGAEFFYRPPDPPASRRL